MVVGEVRSGGGDGDDGGMAEGTSSGGGEDGDVWSGEER